MYRNTTQYDGRRSRAQLSSRTRQSCRFPNLALVKQGYHVLVGFTLQPWWFGGFLDTSNFVIRLGIYEKYTLLSTYFVIV